MKTPMKPNNYFYFLVTIIALLAVPQLMAGHNDNRYNNYTSNIIDVDVVGDYGRHYKQYAVNSNKYNVERAYLEAKDGKSYGIKCVITLTKELA